MNNLINTQQLNAYLFHFTIKNKSKIIQSRLIYVHGGPKRII